MPPTTDTKFAFEGFLPVWAVVLIGVALMGVAWWMARRDAHVAERSKVVWVFFGLRCVAILILLWMLAGPTLVTTMRSVRTKAVAVLVDTSASMGLHDAADGSGNVTRWAAASGSAPADRALLSIDEGVAQLRAALKQLERISKLPNTTPDTEMARALFTRAVRGVETGLDAVKGLILPEPAAESKESVTAAVKSLDEQVLPILRDKAAEFARGKTLAALGREDWMPDRLAMLSVAIAQLTQGAERLAKSIEPLANASNNERKRSRLESVEEWLASAEQTWLKDIRKKAAVSSYQFGERVVPRGVALFSGPAQGTMTNLAPTTRLGAALQQVALDASAHSVEAAILITDGGQNAGRDPRELASALSGTTLHIVPIGNTKMQRDVILHHTHAPKAVLRQDMVVIDSIVTAYDCAGEALQVELLENDTVVDQQTIQVTGEVFDQRVQLRWKAAEPGKHTMSMRTVPVSRERSEENNSAKADVHIMEDTMLVLVADNFPRWETRYLINLFKRDERVTFEQLLFEPQSPAGTGVRTSFPANLEEWSKYRVVILGDLLPAQLTRRQQELLRDYVTQAGGNLVIVAGNDAMPGAYMDQPLGALLPVSRGDRTLSATNPFYLHLADEGAMTLATQIADNPQLSERIWSEMSQRLPLYALSQFSKPKPATHSLLWASLSKTSYDPSDDRTRSFLAWHYVGAGRVVYLAAPITYQLRYRQGDTFHHRFWGQLLRWVVARDLAEGSHNVRLGTDKSRYEQGESVQVSARLRQLDGRGVSGADLQVMATQEGKQVQEIPLKEDASRPGTYHGTLEQLPLGPMTLEVRGERVRALLQQEKYERPLTTTITIDPNDMLELRHPLCNMPLLQELADSSGGLIVPPTGLKAALDQLNLEPEVKENLTKKPLWNRWDLFWIFIACLSLEWIGRKFVGLQ